MFKTVIAILVLFALFLVTIEIASDYGVALIEGSELIGCLTNRCATSS